VQVKNAGYIKRHKKLTKNLDFPFSTVIIARSAITHLGEISDNLSETPKAQHNPESLRQKD